MLFAVRRNTTQIYHAGFSRTGEKVKIISRVARVAATTRRHHAPPPRRALVRPARMALTNIPLGDIFPFPALFPRVPRAL